MTLLTKTDTLEKNSKIFVAGHRGMVGSAIYRKLQKEGLPTVKYMASKLSLSTRYLRDLLKQETGKTALEQNHISLVTEAKNLLISTDNTVAETAYQLGFENPPYFSRLFKKEVGLTPTEYREQFLN